MKKHEIEISDDNVLDILSIVTMYLSSKFKITTEDCMEITPDIMQHCIDRGNTFLETQETENPKENEDAESK